MNRQIIKIAGRGIFCLMACLLLASCEASIPDGGESREVSIQLKVPEMMEVTTKAADTELDGINISRVWVLQFTEDNGQLLKAGKYTSITKGKSGTLDVVTSGFSGVNSRFYILANAPDDFFAEEDTLHGGSENINEAQLKMKTLQLTDNSAQPNFLVAGPVPLTQKTIEDKGGKAVVLAPLERAYAMVELQWIQSATCKDKISITKVEACNIPKKMAVYVRGGADLSSTYPLVTDMTETISVSSSALSVGTKKPFYMPENLRGMGTGTSFSEKGMPLKGPGGKLDGCTYVLLSGEYKYDLGGGNYSSPINVQYKIFIGGNLTNDYNIQRGYWYKLTVNIGGANSADVRVTITDGRVVVFDEVEVMETIIVDF